jgi:hypothetical protein
LFATGGLGLGTWGRPAEFFEGFSGRQPGNLLVAPHTDGKAEHGVLADRAANAVLYGRGPGL